MQGSSSSYQKPQADYITGGRHEFYKLIHSKQNMAILSAAANLSESVIETVVHETINELQSKNLIKKEFQLQEEIIPADSSSFEGKKEEKLWPPPASAASYNLTLKTREVYDLIKKKKNKGIKIEDMIREINFSKTVVRESIKILLAKKLIRVVVISGENCLMLKEYEPAKEVSGFQPYSGGRSRCYEFYSFEGSINY